MEPNPIVDEIHEIRQQILARYGNDLHAYIDDVRRRQGEMGREVVSFPPRRPAGWPENATEVAKTPSDQTRRELLDALARLRKIHPEWRLGQTLANLALAAGRTEAGGIWDLEDEEALAAARRLIERHSEIGADVA